MDTLNCSSSLAQRICAHRKLFLIGLPVCFAVCVGVVCLIPKYYTSSFVVARETQQAVENNRAITLNSPEQYDLGVYRTDNAMQPEGYKIVLTSDAFLYGLLDKPVSTLDGEWQGTLGEYLNCQSNENLDIRYDSCTGWYSNQAVKTLEKLRRSIKGKIDYETRYVTVTCTAGDPMVATQMARYVNESLLRTIDRYEVEKMQAVLEQIKQRAQEAEQAYLNAKEIQAPNQETLGEIARSFCRQQVVYEAQIIHHPAYTTLSEPTVDFRKAGPSKWQGPLVVTLALALVFLTWISRKELAKYIKGA